MDNTGESCAGDVNPIVPLAPESTLEETKVAEAQHLQTEQPIPIPDIVIRNDDVYPCIGMLLSVCGTLLCVCHAIHKQLPPPVHEGRSDSCSPSPDVDVTRLVHA